MHATRKKRKELAIHQRIDSKNINKPEVMKKFIDDILSAGGYLEQTLSNYEPRQEQQAMSNVMADVLLRQKQNAIIEAPTGSGKSLAYSIPAIIASKMLKEPVIISTSTKNLQAQLTEKDLPLLQKIFEKYLKLPFVFALCKGRGNYLCLRRWHRFIDLQASKKKRKGKKKKGAEEIDMFAEMAAENADLPESFQLALKRQEVRNKLKTPDEKAAFDILMDWYVADPKIGDTVELGVEVNKGAIAGMWSKVCSDGDDCMRWQCPYSSNCYFTQAQKAWADADLCIVNHALFFAHRSVLLAGGKGFLPETKSIIFDEADHVPGVAANFFGIEIASTWMPHMTDRFLPEIADKGFIGSMLDAAGKKTITQIISQLVKDTKIYFEKIQKYVGTKRSRRFKSDIPVDRSDIDKGLSTIIGYILRAKQHHIATGNKELLTVSESFLKHFSNFRKKMKEVTSDCESSTCYFAQWNEKQNKYGNKVTKVTITAIPLNTAEMIQKSCQGLHIGYTSATLASDEGLSYFSRAVGVDLDDKVNTVQAVLGSPFNFARNCLLYMPTMPIPSAPDFDKRIAEQIREVEAHIKGGIFVLFTSYMSMTAVSKAIRSEMESKGRQVFVQGEDGPKNVLTQKFRKAKNGLLLGVSSFWVGVDIQGDALSCVMITKMPFERPDEPFNEAMKEYLESQGRSYFKDCDLPRATTMIRQGFGRLIRTKRDRGVVVILDSRLNPSSPFKKRYGDAVLDSLPECNICYELQPVIDFMKEED